MVRPSNLRVQLLLLPLTIALGACGARDPMTIGSGPPRRITTAPVQDTGNSSRGPNCGSIPCDEYFRGMEPLDPGSDDDGDGIFNEFDGAPLLAEDFDNVEDGDGIPEARGPPQESGSEESSEEESVETEVFEVSDLDNDGLPDAYDYCIKEAEDVDGFEDTDGCPDPDNDEDGVLDGDDRCPLLTGENCIVRKLLELQNKIVFKPGAPKMDMRASEPALQELMSKFSQGEFRRLEVRGHSSGQGNPRSAEGLTKRRAKAVRKELIRRGIGQDSIEAIGVGGEEPIASTDTAEGRAQNERVEFYALD